MSRVVVSPFDGVRTSPRQSRCDSAELVVHREESSKPSRSFVLLQDISDGGFCVVHAVQLTLGQKLEIIIDDEPPRPATVAWCKRLPARHFSIGCKFMDVVR